MSGAEEIAARKRQLRAEIKRRLAAMTEDARREGSRTICERIVESAAFAGARTVMMYLPMPDEVDIEGVAAVCARTGRSIVVPRVGWEDHSLSPRRIGSFSESVASARFGVREPAADAERVEIGEIDLVLVPGLAFDERGGRLGRGAGFYDRFLRALAETGSGGGGRVRVVGIAFEEQMVDSVPGEEHDERMDTVVTPGREIVPG